MRSLLPLLLLASLTSAICSAPAPIYRPRVATRAALIGSWRALWADTSCVICFRADGSYACDYAGRPYVGSWALLEGRLVIQEQPADSDHPCQPEPVYFAWDADRQLWAAGPCTVRLLERVAR